MRREPVLRVGRIPYANLFPVFHALETNFRLDGVRFVAGDPSALNRKLRAGRLDLSPSSSIEYAKYPDRYRLYPGISVACRTKVMSVLLLSNDRLSRLSGDPVAVTGSSDTSVILLEILLREFLGKRNRLVRTDDPPALALRRHPAYLAIGDDAIRASLDGTARHVTDLGQWWKKETGMPFVFALWIVSERSMPEKGEALRRFGRTLLAAKELSLESIRSLGRRMIGPEWIPPAYRSEYWRNLSYDLEAETEGLLLFYELARKIGRIAAVPPLRFLDLAGTLPMIK